MKILIINNAEPHDSNFNQPLIEVAQHAADAYDVVDYMHIPDPEHVERTYNAIILSGVPLDYDFDVADQRLPYYEWLKTTDTPTLGICLGHQIIGMLFGSDLIRDDEAENGLLDTTVTKDDVLFTGIGQRFDSFLMHRASITAPENFDVLARTAACRNVIMKYKDRALYGMQLHPELSPCGAALIKNFILQSP